MYLSSAALYLSSAGLYLGAAMMDRLILQRRKVTITSLKHANDDERHIRFALSFSIKEKLRSGSITYTLRDRKNPVTVIEGKKRTLDFSEVGENSEYLLFCKKRLKAEGDWVLDVKITSSGSFVNPFYKLIPVVTTARKEFRFG